MERVMGDFRASIKINVEMGGVKDKTDMWINWSPNDDGVDDRVISFFRNWSEKATNKIRGDIEDGFAANEEARERAQYERLKAKFEK